MVEVELEIMDTVDVDTDKLLRTNSANAARRMVRKLSGKRQWILAHDRDGKLVAGARFFSALGWMTVDSIWVSDEHRRQGVGGRILDVVETAAKDEACKGINMRSYGFEAPDFFVRRGYATVGILPDPEANLTSYWFAKGISVPVQPVVTAGSVPAQEAPVSWRKAKRINRTAMSKGKSK